MLLLALDAATWDVLDPLIDRGLLPNLAKLKAGGTSGVLQSIRPTSSPVVWTTVATGKTPGQHGITFFVRFPDGRAGKPAPVTRTMRRGKALWNILSDARREVAVVGWFVTWPVEEVSGVMVSDRAHFGQAESVIFPPFYLRGLAAPSAAAAARAAPAFMRFDFDPAKLDPQSEDPEERMNHLVYDRFIRAYRRDAYYLDAAEVILRDAIPDFMAVYLRGTDDVQHGFWKFMDPGPFGEVNPDDVDRFGKVIEAYWQWTDRAVGKILHHYRDDDPLVMVISDHGAGPAVGDYEILAANYLHLSGAHRDQGIVILNGPGVREGSTVSDASVYDVAPTLLHYMGLAVGRDLHGKVLERAFGGELARRPIRFVDTYDGDEIEQTDETVDDHPASQADEEILRHLRSLGYIE